jgi:hypothetical protein
MRRICVAIALGCTLSISSTALAQEAYAPPRVADGHPDLGGVWTNSEHRVEATFDPPADQLPFIDRASALVWREKYANYMSGAPQPDFTQGVDTLPNRDRCLMAANAAAPPMTSQGYNDAYQFVQTPSVIVISVEMMRETRIIPIYETSEEARRSHGPAVLQRWTGDSVGWWEGDTLVVETVDVREQQARQSPYPTSPGAIATERFTRTGENALAYHAEIMDPVTYTRPWTVSYTFRPAERLWEYACHEGNYGMANILSGERKVERDMAAK